MASCSRKLFRSLAEQYRNLKPGGGDSDSAKLVWQDMVEGTAAVLKADNGNFRQDLFFKACGYGEG